MDQASPSKAPRNSLVAFRPAVREDSRAVAALICEAGGGLYEFLFDDLIPFMSAVDILAAGVSAIGWPLSHENCFVAADASDRIVGAVNLFPADSMAGDGFVPLVSDRIDHIRPILQLQDRGSMFLNAIAVADGCRGMGVGTQLIDCAERRSLEAGFTCLSLHVWADNLAAVRLYKRLGFVEAGVAEIAPSPRLPHRGGSVLMRKELQRAPDRR